LVGEFACKIKLITKEMLNSVAVGKGRDEELLKYLNEFAEIYEINTKYKIAHFLSQIAHESSFNITSENLNYSENRMKQIFACKRGGWSTDTNTCLLTHRKRMNIWNNPNNYSNNPENLANYVYSSRLGNGNESSGDGYKYRGRGLIQLTGRSNYQMFTNTHNRKNSNDQQDFIQNPELIISSKKYGVESAFIFWDSRNINDIVNGSNVREITILVNGGTNGLADRQTKFNDVLEIIEGI
jgi:predicted chitinase